MLNVKPKKFLGQHFLTEPAIANRIANLLQSQTEELIYEIGPGKGILTKALVELGYEVWAIEIDEESIVYLRECAMPLVKIIHSDILVYEFAKKTSLWIGNLPYNITSPILFRMLSLREWLRRGVFMVQKEVGQRLTAKSGNKEYGILTVLLGAYYDVQYNFGVKSGSFYPPPKVESCVISLERKKNLPQINFEVLKILVKTAFGQRRKTLANACKTLQLKIPDELQKLRAEELSIQDFIALAQSNEARLTTKISRESSELAD